MAAFEGLKTVRLEPKDQNAQESQVFLKKSTCDTDPPKNKKQNKHGMCCKLSPSLN